MKNSTWTITLMAAILIIGCVPSLHSLYSDKDVVLDPALVGVWKSDDGKQTWEFSKKGDRSYRLVFTDQKGHSGQFVAHLTRIEKSLFLDLYPEKLDAETNDFYKLHFVAAHTFVRVPQIEPALELSFLNAKWVQDLLDEKPDAIQHERRNGAVVLTASTEELRKFVRENQDTKNAFTKPMRLNRQK